MHSFFPPSANRDWLNGNDCRCVQCPTFHHGRPKKSTQTDLAVRGHIESRLWRFHRPPKSASLHRHEAREARSSASQLPRTRAADSASCPARTPKRCHSVRRTAHMLARPVQRRERFERGSGRRALHGPDRWRQWRCAAITSGSGERMDRAKSS